MNLNSAPILGYDGGSISSIRSFCGQGRRGGDFYKQIRHKKKTINGKNNFIFVNNKLLTGCTCVENCISSQEIKTAAGCYGKTFSSFSSNTATTKSSLHTSVNELNTEEFDNENYKEKEKKKKKKKKKKVLCVD
eukprot:Trichotokara_eunicae@DN7575_c0_g1_i1.p1